MSDVSRRASQGDRVSPADELAAGIAGAAPIAATQKNSNFLRLFVGTAFQ